MPTSVSVHHIVNLFAFATRTVILTVFFSRQIACTFAIMEFFFTKETIAEVATSLWQQGRNFTVWAFHAPMGAGKTTLIHVLCSHVLQVTDAVSSPTFAIINEYQSPAAGVVYHMDWYRLKGEAEATAAGVEDSLLSGNLCLIEWPDIAPGLLPDDTFHIYISLVDENTRRLTFGSLA